MNVPNIYVKLYGTLYNRRGIHYRLLSPFRFVIRTLANWHIPAYLHRHPNEKIGTTIEGLIVSFTSFPKRINNVWIVVESIKRQTCLPERIILWLSKEQFPTETSIPLSLHAEKDSLFEIRLVDGDIRSHKKYVYAASEYMNNMIFLIDDDFYYPQDIIEKSLQKHKEHNHSIICNYGSQITYDSKGRHLPYTHWGDTSCEDNIFFGTGGGTLFRPSDLYKDFSNIELAVKLTPTGDDIWLNAMARLAGLNILFASRRWLLPIINKKDTTLSSINNGLFQNDIQIKAIEDYYGSCFDRR